MCVSVCMDFIYTYGLYELYIYSFWEYMDMLYLHYFNSLFLSLLCCPPLPSDADLFLNWEHFIDPKLSLISQLGLVNIWVFKADHLILNSLLGHLPWRNVIHSQKLLIPWSSPPRSGVLWSFSLPWWQSPFQWEHLLTINFGYVSVLKSDISTTANMFVPCMSSQVGVVS